MRVAISGTIDGQNWANIFHAQLATSSSITQADLDTWTAAFAGAYKTRLQANEGNNVTYVLCKCILFTPGGGELISLSTMTGSGTGTSPVADDSGSAVLSWLSTVYWRGGKPRTYLPGLFASQVNTDHRTLTSGTITTLQTAAANLRTDINALTAGTITGTTFGFVSFQSGNAERPTPLFFAITGARVHPRLGGQRRRLGKWVN